MIASPAAAAQDTSAVHDAAYYWLRRAEAEQSGDFSGALGLARKIVALAPGSPAGYYAVAREAILAGRPGEALTWLRRLAALGDTRPVEADSVFQPLHGRREFIAVRRAFEQNRIPVGNSAVAVTLVDPDLVPEALAWDSAGDRFIVGSLARRKLVAVAADGRTAELIPPQPGLYRVVGIHLDPRRRQLWFGTWQPVGPDGSETRLLRYDLDGGRITGSWAPADSAAGHLLNDLVIAPGGDVYLTDSWQGWIYRVRAGVDSLEVFVRPDPTRFTGANGITRSADGSRLYVGFNGGLAAVDLATRRVTMLRHQGGIADGEVDGLYWYRGSLIAIQHRPFLNRVVRFDLTADGLGIARATVLERGPTLDLPTTGEVIGNRFFFIANSQFGRLADDGTLTPSDSSVRSLVRVLSLDSLP